MKDRIPSFVVGLYLLLCIALGGSSTTVWTNLGLQLCGIAIIAWAAAAGPRHQQGRIAASLYLLLLFGLFIVLLQLIPLPPNVWAELPGRTDIARSLATIGSTQSWRPISVTPYESALTLFAVIPAIAVFVSTERLGVSGRAIAIAIVAGMIASVFLGTVQLATGPNSWAYLQEIHNEGAIGFFANSNHMGTLLLVAIPMAVAAVVSAKSDRGMSNATRLGAGIALLLFTAAGIVMNGSRAALGLALPILLASVTLFPGAIRWRGPAVTMAAVVLIAGVFLVAGNPIAPVDPNSVDASRLMRSTLWKSTMQPITDSFPIGTGLGSFEQVFHWYENAGEVTRRYVNHAHNDYLEIVTELGAGGFLLILLFLACWATAAIRIWNSALATPFERAATIATAAILAHSIVDYPLRTAAISAIFAACLGLMAQHRGTSAVAKSGESRPTRHVKLG